MSIERDLVSAVERRAARESISLDPDQRQLLARLAALGAQVDRSRLHRASVRGIYVHGPAGRGKSWLADALFTVLPTPRKRRVHFHGFFDDLHRAIQRHRPAPDAIARAVDDVVGDARMLLFDELHVHDSGDARLLTRLLENVFDRGLVVLATSNYAPDDLLPNPIWHPVFEPGIALIEANMDVFLLDGGVDHRTAGREGADGFAAGEWIAGAGDQHPSPTDVTVLTVRDRAFPVVAARDDHLRASFAQLCGAPVGPIEYLDWAGRFSRWTITGIPSFADADAQAQQRFVNLVDILVDRDIRTTFVSPHTRAAFVAAASQRPDAFRMTSRLRMLRGADAGGHDARSTGPLTRVRGPAPGR